MMLHPVRLSSRVALATALGLALCALSSAGCTKRRHAPSPTDDQAATQAQTVEPVIPESADCDKYMQTQEVKWAAAKTCTPTERIAFQKSPKCLACLLHATCLDDLMSDKGNECEPAGDVRADDDFAVGSPEEKQCLAVLACDFGVSPTVSPAPVHGGPNNGPLRALCGDVQIAKCWANGAGGACKDQITAGFPAGMSNSVQTMSLNIAQRRVPAGRAGAIAGCGDNNECKECFE
jgi:hypothetical protein